MPGVDPANTYLWATNWAKPHKQGGARSWGGLLPFGYTMSARQPLQEGGGKNRRHVWWHLGDRQTFHNRTQGGTLRNFRTRCRLTPLDRGYHDIKDALDEVKRERDIGLSESETVANAYRYDLVTVPFKISSRGSMSFSGGTVKFDIYSGKLDNAESSYADAPEKELVQSIEMRFPPFNVTAPEPSPGYAGWVNEFNALSHDSGGVLEMVSMTADPGNIYVGASTKANHKGVPGVDVRNPKTGNAVGRMVYLTNHWDGSSTYIRPLDVVQSVGVRHGDVRLVMAKETIEADDTYFEEHRFYGDKQMAHSLTNAVGGESSGFQRAEYFGFRSVSGYSGSSQAG